MVPNIYPSQVIRCKRCVKRGLVCRVNYAFKYRCLSCVVRRVHCSIALVYHKSGKTIRCDKKGAKTLCEAWQDSILHAIEYNRAHPDSRLKYSARPSMEASNSESEHTSDEENSSVGPSFIRHNSAQSVSVIKAAKAVLSTCLSAGAMPADPDDLEVLHMAGMGFGSAIWLEFESRLKTIDHGAGARLIDITPVRSRTAGKVCAVCLHY